MYNPSAPLLKAIGPYFTEEGLEDDEPYQELDHCHVCWVNEYGNDCNSDGDCSADLESISSDENSYFAMYSDDAGDIVDIHAVEWTQQPETGEVTPWQWCRKMKHGIVISAEHQKKLLKDHQMKKSN